MQRSERRPLRSSGTALALGFSLLEVMAAVLILGILYLTLMRTTIQGVRAEGESRQRLEASLLADRQLSELETQLAAGAAPPVGITELEIGDYEVRIEVEPFEPPIPDLPGASASAAAPTTSPFAPGRGDETPLRRITLRVEPIERYRDLNVVRTTFGFDLAAVAGILSTLPAPDAAGNELGGDGPEGPDEDEQ